MKQILFFFVLALPVLTARSAEVMVCPPWEITVVDEAGKPLAGCVVVQEWGCDFNEVYVTGATNSMTDAAGRVSFPARNVSPPAGESRWKKIERAIDRTTRGKPGASVFISKPGFQFDWLTSKNEPRNVATPGGLRARVVLKPEKR